MKLSRTERPEFPVPSSLLTRLEDHPSFTRGLVLGMLAGAAIAGSTIWSRIRASSAPRRGGTERQRDGGEDRRAETRQA